MGLTDEQVSRSLIAVVTMSGRNHHLVWENDYVRVPCPVLCGWFKLFYRFFHSSYYMVFDLKHFGKVGVVFPFWHEGSWGIGKLVDLSKVTLCGYQEGQIWGSGLFCMPQCCNEGSPNQTWIPCFVFSPLTPSCRHFVHGGNDDFRPICILVSNR